MRRSEERETVSHAAIMAKLEAVQRTGEEGRAVIYQRLDAGVRRFETLEGAVQPLTDLIEAMGGKEQFKELAIDAARGLAALAWLGAKLGTFMRWLAAVAAGMALAVAFVKFVFGGFGKG